MLYYPRVRTLIECRMYSFFHSLMEFEILLLRTHGLQCPAGNTCIWTQSPPGPSLPPMRGQIHVFLRTSRVTIPYVVILASNDAGTSLRLSRMNCRVDRFIQRHRHKPLEQYNTSTTEGPFACGTPRHANLLGVTSPMTGRRSVIGET